MSNILNTINNASSKVQTVLDNVTNGLGNQYVKYGLVVMLTMYAGFLGPELPTTLSNLFKNKSFKIIFFFLFLLIVQSSLKISYSFSILMVIAFVLTIDYLYLDSIREDFKNNKRETFN